jgi:hypothetical protein
MEFLFNRFIVCFFLATLMLSSFTHALTSFRATPLDRIGITQVANGPLFYNTVTGSVFVPRGNNYIRLGSFADPWFPTTNLFDHNLFQVGTYSAVQADAALAAMSAQGYNVVRVFPQVAMVGNPVGSGLDAAYMQNIADFLQRARNNNMRVLMVFWQLPRMGGYQPAPPYPSYIAGQNLGYLWQPAINKKKNYVTDFIAWLQNNNSALDAIFGWDIENEAHLNAGDPPLSYASGLYPMANGGLYDMASVASRQQLVDEGLGYYVNQIYAAIKAADPNHLVTMSFFSPGAVGVGVPNDMRRTRTRWMILDPENGGSNLDFVDLHLYVGLASPVEQLLAFEILPSRKPLIFGEMGVNHPAAYHPAAYPGTAYHTVGAAATALRQLQANTCSSAFRINGWITYTWDTTETYNNIRDYYTATESSSAISNALSPLLQSDPCAAVPINNHASRGSLDNTQNCNVVWGWAQDQDIGDWPIKVDFYVDASSGGSAWAGNATADSLRTDLCTPIGSCRHGFGFNIPTRYRDGQQHMLYAYALDSDGVHYSVLSGSPKAFTCH